MDPIDLFSIQIDRLLVLIHSGDQTDLLAVGSAHVQTPHQRSHQILAG